MKSLIFSILVFCSFLELLSTTRKQHSIGPNNGAQETQHLAPSLRGSRTSLYRQNLQANRERLERIDNEQRLRELRRAKGLTKLPQNKTLAIDSRLKNEYRFCRPWTCQFLTDLGRDYYKKFKKPLTVNSAVRTLAYQQRLRSVNANAAPARGEMASSHLTGSTVDLAKKGMAARQIGWLRGYLYRLEKKQKIEATEEFSQAVFHVMVFKNYRKNSITQLTVRPNRAAPISQLTRAQK